MLKNLLLLAGFSTFVVIVIVALDIYHKSKVSSLQPSTQRNIVPITPTFDKKTLEKLKSREQFSVDLREKSTIISADTQSTTASPTPTPTLNDTEGLASQGAATTGPSSQP